MKAVNDNILGVIIKGGLREGGRRELREGWREGV